MPKLNVTHLVGRIQERIEQLERGDALEARDINALLNPLQQKQLKTAWAKQQHLRTLHKPPKTEDEKNKLGWKTIREVRLEVYKQALDDLLNNLVTEMEKIQHKSEVRAGRVFMDAFSDAHKNGKNAWSAGNIALRRNGFNRIDGQSYSYSNKRDREVNEMEDGLRKRLEKDLTEDDKEQLELSKQHDKSKRKLK